MYPSSSSSSSSQQSMPPAVGAAGCGGGSSSGLVRYGSAPSSFLSTAVDSAFSGSGNNPSSSPRHFSAVGSHHPSMFPPPPRPHHHAVQPSSAAPSFFGHYFSGDSQSTCKVNAPASGGKVGPAGGLHRAFGLSETELGSSSPPPAASASTSLVRQRSSPAGFLSHLTSENGGFSLTRGGGSSSCGHGSMLKTQLSFTRQDSLSQVSEVSENAVNSVGAENGHHNPNQSSYTNFGLDSWENNSIVFSSPLGKHSKMSDGDMYSFSTLETQFSLPQTTLEMATVEKLLNIPDDSVPCKIRAKRGFATHPRSIAERERRTRISGRLKKLQELVPNMDKQTSYADMLDLAVEHIKALQNQVHKLRQDLRNCTCGCKPSL